MSTLKVDTVEHPTSSSAVDLPNKLKIGGATIEQGYTASGSEPGSANTGDWWWDTSNNKLYRYINGEFKLLGLVAPNVQYGDRGFAFGAGSTPNQIQYIDITSAGNAQDFGDLLASTTSDPAGYSNGARACSAGGNISGMDNDTIQYWASATLGNASDFGNLVVARYSCSGCSDGTYGLTFGGYGNEGSGNGDLNNIEYVTIATTGNGTDFGDMVANDGRGGASTANATRGIRFAGQGGANDSIQYVTIATPGNATDFGDLTHPREYTSAFADSTRACCAGGDSDTGGNTNTYNTNVIDYVTIANTGNATDFGDMTNSKRRVAATSNFTRGVIFGGTTGTGSSDQVNNIDFVVIQTTANASDFGDLLSTARSMGATSGAAA